MPGEDKAVVASLAFTPFQVLSMNPPRFQEAFQEWRFNTWLADKKAIVQEILADDQNKQRLHELSTIISGGAVVPYIGAGMSFQSGFLLWDEFLHELRVHCIPAISKSTLNAVILNQGYEDAAELIIAHMPPRLYNDRFESLCSLASWSTVKGAILFLPHLFPGNALTTNFDNVLEVVYELHNHPFEEVLYGREITNWPRFAMQHRTCLLKLHGHGTRPDTRILSRSEYDDAYAAGCPHRAAMENVVKHSVFLFMGCGLGSDRTLSLIKEVYESAGSALPTKNFAILPMPKTPGKRLEREAFLAEMAIYPIWYGDYGKTGPTFPHDGYVEAILVELLDRQGKIENLTVSPEVPSHLVGGPS